MLGNIDWLQLSNKIAVDVEEWITKADFLLKFKVAF